MVTKTIGILTGGGDCPGLNSAIKAVAKTSIESFMNVVGIKEGWRGLLDNELIPLPLSLDSIRHIDRLGGTILGTSRTNPYKINNGPELVKKRMEELNLHALVVIGGEDTLGVAAKLYEDFKLNIVAIPKTIDRDLSYTDYSLGFESAIQVITDSVDALRTTAESHARIFVVEVMGRHAGHLALRGTISSGASIALIPEFPFSIDRVCELLLERKRAGVRYSIVLVAEGATVVGEDMSLLTKEVDAFGHVRLGGIGQMLASAIENRASLESRAVVLSHLQRGGKPVAYDRRLGFYFGVGALEAILKGYFGSIIALKKGRLILAPIREAVRELGTVNVNNFYDTKKYRPLHNILGKIGPTFDPEFRRD